MVALKLDDLPEEYMVIHDLTTPLGILIMSLSGQLVSLCLMPRIARDRCR